MSTISFSIFDVLPGRSAERDARVGVDTTAEQRRILCTELGNLAARPGSPLADTVTTLITDLSDPIVPRRVRRDAMLAAEVLVAARCATPDTTHEVRILGLTHAQIDSILAEERAYPLPTVWPAPPSSAEASEALYVHARYRWAIEATPITDYVPIEPACALIPGEDFQPK